MPARADTTPLLVRPSGVAEQLVRAPFDDRRYDEAWLQALLFQHPALIPVDDVEPVFAPPIAVAREVPTPTGPLDLLCVNPDGYPTLIETKLWRNPEARRQAVAQVIDYATQLSRWSYDELVVAVRKARPDLKADDPFRTLLSHRVEEFEETRFIDTLSRNLRCGRMLLLIIGDGIHESVEQMAETLGGAPQLGFTLGLIELSLYRLPDSPDAFIVQPRVVARTREVLRAVVEVRREVRPEDVRVTLPPIKPDVKRISLTEEEFYRRLAAQTSASTAQKLREFLTILEELGVTIVGRQASLSMHYVEPTENRRFSLGSIYTDGHVDMYFVRNYVMREGLPESIALGYLNALAQLVENARVDLAETRTGDMKSAIKVGDRHVQIDELLEHGAQWRAAVEAMIEAINRVQGESR